ncbi:MAG: response regulator [Chitinophagaceae bacterium]|nr:response regulator [Chitinophagaceae bacterium]
MIKLRCIAVDDEPLALALVCNFIEQTPFLELAGRYSSAIEALKSLHSMEIQLIFMDIQMPDFNGMELAKVLARDRSTQAPKIIFTTAYNHFALESYRVDALDYLLKPFNYEEFLHAAGKAKDYVERSINNAADIESNSIFIKVEYKWVNVLLSDILYIEGVKDYVKIYLSTKSSLLSLNSLKNMEDKLPARQFMRLNRSCIVSLSKITAVTKTAVQINDIVIPVGENYRESFSQFIKNWIV